MDFFELTDDEWKTISQIFPAPTPKWPRRGRPHSDIRRIVNAIIWILTTGRPWSEIPFRYPSIPTIRRRYAAWKSNGILDELIAILAASGRAFSDKRIDVINSHHFTEYSTQVNTRASTSTISTALPSPTWIDDDRAVIAQQSNDTNGPYSAMLIDTPHSGSPRTVRYTLSVQTDYAPDGTIHTVAEITIKDESNMLRSTLAGIQFSDSTTAKRFVFDWALNQIFEYV